MGHYVKHINYGAYDLPVTGADATWGKFGAGEGQRKTTRPDRLSFCREGGRGASSSSSCMVSSLAGWLALNRRFGASETKAGKRNPSFLASVFSSEIILPVDSQGHPRPDVSSS